jgi:hypothetical protein
MHIWIMTDKSDKGHKPSTRSLARWENEGGASKNRGLKRPRDPIALARLIGDIDTSQIEERVDDGKDPTVKERARAGSLKGGKARAKRMSSRARSASARKAAKARQSRSP